MNNQNPDITIIIVNWNTREALKKCLFSLYEKNKAMDFNTIVVDNGSTDGSVEMIKQNFPQVRIIANEQNLGYARANNLALKSTPHAKYFLLLNSDIEFKTNEPLRYIIHFMENHPEIGIVGARLLFPNGTIQALGREVLTLWRLVKWQLLFTRSPFFLTLQSLLLNHKNFTTPLKSDYIDGAFFFIRGEVIKKIGLMNEKYFLYGEDMDWCLRARRAGWKIIVLPEIEIIHYHGISTLKNLSYALQQSLVNNCQLLKEMYGKRQARIGYFIYMLGMLLRSGLHYFKNHKKSQSYWQAFKSCLKIRVV